MKMKKKMAIALSLLLLLAMAVSCASPSAPSTQDTPDADTPAADTPAADTPAAEDENTPAEEDSPAADTATEYTPVPTDTTGTLKVWFDNDDIFNALQAAFNEKYPNITLEYELVGNVDTRNKLQLDGPAGIGADVFCMPHDHIGLALQDGLVEPIDPLLEAKLRKTLVATANDTLTFEGAMYAVPITLENPALFYNKDLWGENPPATMEEVIEFAATYNDPAANKWAMAWQVDDAYHNFHWLSAFGMELMGPDHRDYKAPGFDTPEALAGVEYYQSLRKALFDVPVADGQWDGSVARFQNGEIPLCITGPWAIADAQKNGVNFGVAKLPTINGKDAYSMSGVIIAAMSSYSENPELAYTWLDFLAGPEGAAILYGVGGKLPALIDQSQVEGLSDDEYLKGIMAQSQFAIPMPAIPEMEQAWAGMKELFTHPWEGALSPADAQVKAMQTYKDLLQAADKDIDF